jgi:hypothetical protein
MHPAAEAAVAIVAKRFETDPEDVFGRRKTQALVRARAISYYLLRHRDYSYPEIGDMFSRDHTTVMISVRRLEKEARENEPLQAAMDRLVTLFLNAEEHDVLRDGLYIRITEKVHTRLQELVEQGYYGDTVSDVARALLGAQLAQMEKK